MAYTSENVFHFEYSLPYSINKKSYNHELMKMYVLSTLDNYGLCILVNITVSLTETVLLQYQSSLLFQGT